eukprot:7219440-Pyramimonas_sp.AAC.1
MPPMAQLTPIPPREAAETVSGGRAKGAAGKSVLRGGTCPKRNQGCPCGREKPEAAADPAAKPNAAPAKGAWRLASSTGAVGMNPNKGKARAR